MQPVDHNRPNMNEIPFHRKVLITLGIAIPSVLVILLMGVAFKMLLLVLAGALIAIGIHAIAGRLRTHLPLNEAWSKALAVILVLGLGVVIWIVLVPRVSDQLGQLKGQLPDTFTNAKREVERTKIGSLLLRQLPDDPKKFIKENSQLMTKGFGVFSTTFGILGDLFVIVLLSLFFIMSPSPYLNGMVALIPKKGRPRAREVLDELHITLERWLKGQLLSMLLVGVLTAIGLWALGVPLALALGVGAGLLCFIPNFGPLISLIPAVLVALMEGPQMALYVVLLYVGIQFVESNFITPFIQKKMVDLPLAMIMVAQVTLGLLTGSLGLILATPIVLIIIRTVRMLYVEDVLEGETNS